MKNSTKVRLHLSKQLFESLTREIIKEAKANDGYTVAVKQPKQPKQSKSQATSPEVQKTDAEAMMGEVHAQADTKKMEKMHEMETDVAEGKMNSEFEKEILKVLKAKFDLDPTTATIDFGPNGMSIKPVNYQVWADKFTKGNQGRNGNYVDDKAQKIAAYFNKKYGKNLVAEEGQVNEFTGTETESSGAIAMIAAALGMGIPLAAALIKDLMRAKSPEEKKQIIQKKLADKGTDAGMDKGTDALKEYENDDYRVVNGQCRRYNDEHEYTVVSMSYCR